MILLSLAAALVAETVSFENPGIRLEPFLKEFGKQVGQELRCSPLLKNEVLSLSFQSQPLEAVKKELAIVVHATWEKRDSEWWLIQTDEQKKEEKVWHRDRKAKKIQCFLDSLSKFKPKKEWTAEDAARFHSLMTGRMEGGLFYGAEEEKGLSFLEVTRLAPPTRLVANMASLLKPEHFKLDRIDTYRTNYYSNDGLEGVDRLPVDYSGFLNQFAREVDLARMTRLNPEVKTPVRLLIAEHPLSVWIYDRDWVQIEFVSLGAPEQMDLRPVEEKFPLPDDLRELETKNEFPGPHSLAAKTWPIFLNAERQDPLGIAIGKKWVEFAKRSGKPMVASLNDFRSGSEVVGVPALEQTEFKIGSHRLDQDGWILGAPYDPLDNRARRADRANVRRFAQLVTTSSNSIHDQVERAALGVEFSIDTYGVPYRKFLPNDPRPGRLMEAYGLAIQAKGASLKSLRMAVGNLPERAFQYLQHSRNSGEFLDFFTKPNQGYVHYCPFKALPDRELRQSVFEAEQSNDEVCVLTQGSAMSSLSMEQFATFYKEWLAHPASFESHKIQFGSREVLKLRLSLGERRMNETYFGLTGQLSQAYRFDNLPEGMKARLLRLGGLP